MLHKEWVEIEASLYSVRQQSFDKCLLKITYRVLSALPSAHLMAAAGACSDNANKTSQFALTASKFSYLT